MGRDYPRRSPFAECPPLPARKALTPDDQVRVLGKLRQLEVAAMFTPDWREVETDLWRWETGVRAGHVWCHEVPRMAAAFERYGVGEADGRVLQF